jgi:hypothetical protein
MKYGQISHFQDAVSSEAFYTAKGLTTTALKRRGLKSFTCPA